MVSSDTSSQPKTFAAWLRLLFRKGWVEHAKPPFGGREYVLWYLGGYTHRVAISKHRLISLTEETSPEEPAQLRPISSV